jgi:hypothetical protein
MTQFVAKSAESVRAFIIPATADALRRIARLPEALAHAIEKVAIGK